ncbi:MAG: aspartate aminotransferase family protein [Bacillaceae bacterium]|nr:aspartate aminotransferase family protein [Bacillaceae bacterium]
MTHVIKPELDKSYPTVSYGKGIYLYDTEGKQYIDACSGAVTASIGHGVEEIARVMKDQAEKVAFSYRSQFTSEPAEKLAKKLSDWAPGDLNQVFFVNSGSEATETAMKIAVQYWQEQGKPTKTRVLSRWMSYHGITLGALSMSGHAARRKRFVPLLEDLPVTSPPHCYRCPLGATYPSCHLLCARELENAILRIGADHVAAFIAEPVIGASGGAIVPPKDYYQEIRDICDRHNILFIADEVMTGAGRTGKKFAIEHWGVVPDIIALGKGLSAGYTPLSATLVSESIIDVIRRGSGQVMSGHTFSANPLSTAISLAVMEYMEQHDLIRKAADTGNYLLEQLTGLAHRHPVIGHVRGIGLLCGIEFVANQQTLQPFSPEQKVTYRITERAFEKGLILYPAVGALEDQASDAIMLAPPLIIKKEEIDRIIEILDETIQEIEQELKQEGSMEHFHAG